MLACASIHAPPHCVHMKSGTSPSTSRRPSAHCGHISVGGVERYIVFEAYRRSAILAGMDPYAPINGISLERYAELSADCADTQDPNQQAEIVAKKGVQRADWEAAKAGWTARMADMSLMGQVATRFMPLYNAELAKKSGGAPTVSFEDYVAMSGTAKAIGYEGMLAHYKVTPAQWTQIGMHWNSKIPTNPQYMQFGILVEQEGARIQAGGQPKTVTLGAPGAAPSPAAATVGPHGAQGGMPGAMPGGYPQQPQAWGQPQQPQQPPQQAWGQQPNPYAQQAHGHPWGSPQQQNQFDRDLSAGFNSLGNALAGFGAAVETGIGMYSPGQRVFVLWSDGQRYPGTVMSAMNGQVQIAFPDGRQVWVPAHACAIA
jgi:hypothetical protein